MAGTVEGGKSAARTNKKKYGKKFYSRIGSEGGKQSTTGGFWHTKYVLNDVESVRQSGRKGGYKSRRKPKEK